MPELATCFNAVCHIDNAAHLYLSHLALILMGAGAAGLILHRLTAKG